MRSLFRHRPGVFALAWLAAAFASASLQAQTSVQPGQGVSFFQADMEGTPARIDSETGWLVVNLPTLRSATGMQQGYLNVGMSGQWVVRNLPILPVAKYDYPGISTTFNFAVATGTNITQRNFDVQLSANPMATWAALAPASFPVTELDVAVGGEGAGEAPPPPAPGLAALEVQAISDVLVDNSNQMIQLDHPNVQASNNQCAPASVANSLQFLANTTGLSLAHPHRPGIRGETVPVGEQPSLISQIDEAMNRTVPDPSNRRDPNATGTPVKNQLEGKLKYLLNNGLKDKIETVFWSEFDDTGADISTTVDGVTATAKFMGKSFTVGDIVQCLRDGGDVEAGYYWEGGAHAVEIIGAGSTRAGTQQVDWIIEASDIDQGDDAKGTGREGFIFRRLKDTDGDGSLNIAPTKELRRVFCERYKGDPVTTTTSVTNVETTDPAGHSCCVDPPPDDVDLTAGPGSAFAIAGPVEWLPMTGTIAANGSFDATRTGTVAGFSNVVSDCLGMWVPGTGGNMSCTIGSNGALPTGQPIIFDMDLVGPAATQTWNVSQTTAAGNSYRVAPGNTLIIGSGATWTINGAADIGGTLRINSGASVVGNGIVSIGGTVLNLGAFNVRAGGNVGNNGLIDNRGTLNSSGRINNAADFQNTGTLNLSGKAQFTNTGSYTDSTSGRIVVDTTALLSNTLRGTLIINGQNGVQNNGRLLNNTGSTLTIGTTGGFVNAIGAKVDNYGAIANGGLFTNNGALTSFCGASLSGTIGNVPPIVDCPTDDLAWFHPPTGNSEFWRMNGTVVAGMADLPGRPAAGMVLSAIGDFNGDGQLDLFWRGPTVGTGTNTIWLMDGESILDSGNIPSLDSQWTLGGVADFDGDGKDDILWRRLMPTAGDNSIWMMNGLTRKSTGATSPQVGSAWKIAGTGDFNGDGKNDILWRNAGQSKTVAWLMNGRARSSQTTLPARPTAWTVAGIGDVNANGKDDILWRLPGSGQNLLWIMNGTAVSQQPALPVLATAWTVGALGDFDGDGKDDVFWRNKNTGQNRVWLLNGGTVKSNQATTTQAVTAWKVIGAGRTD